MPRTDDVLLESTSWTDLVSKLDSFGTNPEYKTLKGAVFERLTECLLRLDPVYKAQFRNVWHHSKLPIHVRDKLGLPHPEIGVDLVAECNENTYCAVQCKFHQNPCANVSYSELSTFFGVTERPQTNAHLSMRLIVTSAENISKRVRTVHPEKLSIVSVAKFRTLDNEWFKKIHRMIEGDKVFFLPFVPNPHQKKAVRKVVATFEGLGRSRGKVIHPCGAGKSLTAFWIAREMCAKSVLVAVPSLALVKQTLNTWAREATANDLPFEWIAICSDQGVGTGHRQAFETQDLGIAVTTDSSKLRDFLLAESGSVKAVFTTYQSGQVLVDACQADRFSFDLGIFDEAHKTAGNRKKKFAVLLDDQNLKISKRLFMTATERQFRGDSDKFYSMDDKAVYGEVIDQLSFKAALSQQPPILSDYKVVTCVVQTYEIKQFITENTLINLDEADFAFESHAATFAAYIATAKLTEDKRIRHAITFHSTIERAKQFASISKKTTAAPTGLHSFHISGKLSAGERSTQLARFVSKSPSTISNAKCLTEGVDIPVVDAVVFADPKQSIIDIVQAAGRAMRRHPAKEIGYIVIPVIIDEMHDEPANQVFQQLIKVVAALGLHDDRIIDEAKERIKPALRTVPPILEFVQSSPQPLQTIDFADLVRDIEIKTWDRLSFAKSVVGESEFAEWMRESTQLSPKTIKNYNQAVRKISNDLVKRDINFASLHEITERANLAELKEYYFSIDEFKDLDVRGNGMYSAGFNKLIEYQKSKSS